MQKIARSKWPVPGQPHSPPCLPNLFSSKSIYPLVSCSLHRLPSEKFLGRLYFPNIMEQSTLVPVLPPVCMYRSERECHPRRETQREYLYHLWLRPLRSVNLCWKWRRENRGAYFPD